MESTVPAVLILAAGRGTRMKSEKPKVLHQLLGRALVEHVLNAALSLKSEKVVLVTGLGAEEVENEVRAFMAGSTENKPGPAAPVFVRQAEQLGTGHAVAMAREALRNYSGPLLIIYGDMPLISPDTLGDFFKAHQSLAADISVLTVTLDDPSAYGRIIRDQSGWLKRIVECRDADEEQRQVKEINSGIYLAEASKIFAAIDRLKPVNDQGEYYLTDVVADFREQGLRAAAVELPHDRAYEVRGINDRYELAQAQALFRDKINETWMKAGVTMLDPSSTLIEISVSLSPDVTLWPGVILTGRTKVEPGAEIGPYCHLHHCRVAAGAKVPGHQNITGADLGPGVGGC